MGSIPYAFSVHHFISSVGSDAGFAAIIGLALLILLYFAHARETASLREQLYEWTQRAQQLEARVAQLSNQLTSLSVQRAQAEARPVPAGARVAPSPLAQTRTGAPAPVLAGAPAGVAAPALTAATKLIPTVPVPPPIAPPAPATPIPGVELPLDATAVVSPPPVTVAGGSNGSGYDHFDGEPVSAGRAAPPPRVHIRSGTQPPGRRPGVPPRGQPHRATRSRGRRAIAVVLVVVAAAAVVAGLVALTSSGGSQPKVASHKGHSRNAAAARHRAAAALAPVNPSSVTVAVLNGTATTGLAGRVSLKLTGAGYKPGTVATAADQTHASTIVAYMTGQRRDALAVAASLKLGQASVQPVDQSTQSVACPPPAACIADVIVTVGADLANTQ